MPRQERKNSSANKEPLKSRSNLYFPLSWLRILEKIPRVASSAGLSITPLSSLWGCLRNIRLSDPVREERKSFLGVPSLSLSLSILPKEFVFALLDALSS